MEKLKNIEVDLMKNSKKASNFVEAQAEKEHNESESAYVSYKERHDPSTKYIDEKRKSFPIRKGHECTDLEAAARAFGRYKGSMSHDVFKAKVLRMMKEHSCPIPKTWEKDKK